MAEMNKFIMIQFTINIIVCVLILTESVSSAANHRNAYGIKMEDNNSRFQYNVAGNGSDSITEEKFTVVNLDLLEDEELAEEVEAGVQEEFDMIDHMLGEEISSTSLPEHREDRQMSLIYRGVYTPDARFNAFVDGVMVNMVTEMRRRRMDPLYFRVHSKGIIEHVPTRRRTGRGAMKNKKNKNNNNRNDNVNQSTRGDPIGGGVIKGLSKVKRFGNAEVQMAGNTTLVRSHHVFGPIEIEISFETPEGPKVIRSDLSSLAGHGLSKVTPTTSDFLDFIIDSPSDYEITLKGSKNERFLRLSRSAIMRLVRREGRLEKRLMRMFERAGKKPLKKIGKKNIHDGKVLWSANKRNKTEKGEKEDFVATELKKSEVEGIKKILEPKKKKFVKNKDKMKLILN